MASYLHGENPVQLITTLDAVQVLGGEGDSWQAVREALSSCLEPVFAYWAQRLPAEISAHSSWGVSRNDKVSSWGWCESPWDAESGESWRLAVPTPRLRARAPHRVSQPWASLPLSVGDGYILPPMPAVPWRWECDG